MQLFQSFFVADDVEDPENILHPALPSHHPPLHHPPAHLHPHHLPHPPTKMTMKTPGSCRASNRARLLAVASRSRTPCSGSSVTIATPGTIWTACRTTCCHSTQMQTSTAAAAEAETTETFIRARLQLFNKPNMLRDIVLLQSNAWGVGRFLAFVSRDAL